MKDLSKFINEQQNEDPEEFLEKVVAKAKEDPAIYNDYHWDPTDDFDYWESSTGEYDDTIEFIKQYGENKGVVGWKSEKSFEEVEAVLPPMMKTMMKSSKPQTPYKKRSNQFDFWETKKNGLNCTLMKFMAYKNNNGTDYVEYWYLLAVEE